MRLVATLLAFLGTGMLAASHLAAQDKACAYRLVSIYVLDAQGRAVGGITPADFEAQSHGEPVKILSTAPDLGRHRVVILLDASGSMAPAWDRALSVASHFTDLRLPGTQMALIVFGEKTREELNFEDGQLAIAARLRTLASDQKLRGRYLKGGTALDDALLRGLELLGTPGPSDALYVITDGGENSSDTQPGKIRRLMSSSGAHLFVSILLSSVMSRSREAISGPIDLNDLIRNVGGLMVSPFVRVQPFGPMTAEAEAELKIFHEAMVQDYRVELELSEPVDKSRDWELKLSKERREQWPHVKLLYAKELPPCQL
jgi:von Willebrand factor type A domain